MRNTVRLGQGAVAAIVLVGCVLAIPARSEAASCTSYTSPEATFTDGNCVVGSGKVVLRGGTYQHHFNGETLHNAEVAQLTASDGTKTIEKAGYLLTPNFEGELLGSASIDAAGRFHAQETRYGIEDFGVEGKLYNAEMRMERETGLYFYHILTKQGYLSGPTFEGELSVTQTLNGEGGLERLQETRYGIEDLGIEGKLYNAEVRVEHDTLYPFHELTKHGHLEGPTFHGELWVIQTLNAEGGLKRLQERRYGTEDLGAEGKLHNTEQWVEQEIGPYPYHVLTKHGYVQGPMFEGELWVTQTLNAEGGLERLQERRYGIEDLGAEGKLYNAQVWVEREIGPDAYHILTKHGYLQGPTFEGELSMNMEINEEGAIRYGEHVLDGAWRIDNHEFIGQLRVINNEGIIEVIDTRTSDPGGVPPGGGDPNPGSGGF